MSGLSWYTHQHYALQNAEGNPRRVFCAQKRYPECRRFLTATLPDFVTWYFSLTPDIRHLYEVVTEECHCRLYFDVEYSTAANPNANESVVVRVLKDLIVQAVDVFLNVSIDHTAIVDLSASTTTKMSHHLIVDIPGHIFTSALAVGTFVREMHRQAVVFESTGVATEIFAEGSLTQQDVSQLFVNSNRGRQFVVDMCVYRRNQQFRLLGSSKMKLDANGVNLSSNFLEPGPDNRYPLPTNDFDRLEATLIVPASISGRAMITTEFFDDAQPTPALPRPLPLRNTTLPVNTEADDLAAFVLSYARIFVPDATISTKQATPDGNAVRFHVRGAQWCSNVERAHKSNRVYYLVSFNTNTLIQRCYDPDCLEYRGEAVSLPPELRRN